MPDLSDHLAFYIFMYTFFGLWTAVWVVWYAELPSGWKGWHEAVTMTFGSVIAWPLLWLTYILYFFLVGD